MARSAVVGTNVVTAISGYQWWALQSCAVVHMHAGRTDKTQAINSGNSLTMIKAGMAVNTAALTSASLEAAHGPHQEAKASAQFV